MRRDRPRGCIAAAGVVGALLLAPPATAFAAATPSTDGCAPGEGDAATDVVGPADAATVIDLFLDPAHVDALATWLEVRRLVSEHGGALAVRVFLVRGTRTTSLITERVRTWAVAAQRNGLLHRALRILARDGAARVHARLVSPDLRAGLAAELGSGSAPPPGELDSGCARRRLDEATARMDRIQRRARVGTMRPPLFTLGDEAIFEDGPYLGKLRPALARRARTSPPPPPEPTPELKGVSAEMRRPAEAKGALLGGRGLPHRLLLFASREDDGTLTSYLPFALRFRSEHPGRLSIQVVARGRTDDARLLRRRLCAAAQRGLELDYLRHLARDPTPSRAPTSCPGPTPPRTRCSTGRGSTARPARAPRSRTSSARSGSSRPASAPWGRSCRSRRAATPDLRGENVLL